MNKKTFDKKLSDEIEAKYIAKTEKPNWVLVSTASSMGQTTFKIEDGCAAENKQLAVAQLIRSKRYKHGMAVIERKLLTSTHPSLETLEGFLLC